MGGIVGSFGTSSPAASSIVISNADTPDTTKCDSCDFSITRPRYNWELVDEHVIKIALNFREELIPWNDDKKKLKKKISSISKGYLTLGLQHMTDTNIISDLRDLFNKAKEECDPCYIVEAYCKSQSFTQCLNDSMARIILHDISQGCTKFSCDTLYATEDGTKSIASIFFYHQKFITYTGTVYRGAFNQMNFEHIKVKECIMINTFLSTSKSKTVANKFAAYDEDTQKLDKENDPGVLSSLFTFIVKNIDGNRRALDISGYSRIPDEEEVIILPYSTFLVTKKETIALRTAKGKRIEIELEECDENQLRSSLNQQ
ncbi:unnamed protein product [Rotaria magnacalcarata]|uniref:NAD(+)--protein-arginine ADP-ribosyltransferase n=1 Tax=Rotaria magnacalcarata TaxID=392030 RepID=A0A818Z1Q4_9BILA|nr:unnamed protein product [Rotaria magnacalcarata]CAF3763549.1 unnamed protein product [Rotaria magnacalcarata]